MCENCVVKLRVVENIIATHGFECGGNGAFLNEMSDKAPLVTQINATISIKQK